MDAAGALQILDADAFVDFIGRIDRSSLFGLHPVENGDERSDKFSRRLLERHSSGAAAAAPQRNGWWQSHVVKL